jgi:hypothetical protein
VHQHFRKTRRQRSLKHLTRIIKDHHIGSDLLRPSWVVLYGSALADRETRHFLEQARDQVLIALPCSTRLATRLGYWQQTNLVRLTFGEVSG